MRFDQRTVPFGLVDSITVLPIPPPPFMRGRNGRSFFGAGVGFLLQTDNPLAGRMKRSFIFRLFGWEGSQTRTLRDCSLVVMVASTDLWSGLTYNALA